jgi:hypothetical protein
MAALGKVNQTLTSQKNPLMTQAVTAGVTLAIAKQPNAAKFAAELNSMAKIIAADAASPTATVAMLEATLNAEIGRVSSTPQEKAAFAALAITLEAALNTYISTNPGGPITSATLVSIQGLALAVESATQFYAPVPGA